MQYDRSLENELHNDIYPSVYIHVILIDLMLYVKQSNRCEAKSENGYEHGISHLFIVVLMEHGIHSTMHTTSRFIVLILKLK